jgi:hypothetical protein
MAEHERGTSLCEVLLALTLLSATAAWGLAAAAAAERAAGIAQRRILALHRADDALGSVAGLPCDSAVVAQSAADARWTVDAARVTAAHVQHQRATVRSRAGDTLTVSATAWCD